jgi:hydroxymethylbilane synthase
LHRRIGDGLIGRRDGDRYPSRHRCGLAHRVALVDALTEEPALRSYHLLPSVRGDLLRKLRRFEEARAEFERAAALTRNVRERALLLDRAASARQPRRRSASRGLRRGGSGPTAPAMSPWSPARALRIGTRGSPLARAQSELARRSLASAHPALARPEAIEIVIIRTTGDRVQDRPLSEIGGKGLFTKEIEEALLAGDVDLAVHSMKDLPTWLPDGLVIACVLPREDPRDVLIAPQADSIATLPRGARVGTASLRRQAQLLALRPDLSVVTFRGNVDTRLRKLAAGEVDATLLALAGLRRLGRADEARAILEPAEMLPAVAQGAIGIEMRADDAAMRGFLAPLDHGESAVCVAAERALLAALEGSCRTPIAALAERQPPVAGVPQLRLRSLIALPDGSEVHRDERSGPAAEAQALGHAAAETLKNRAGPAFFSALAQA